MRYICLLVLLPSIHLLLTSYCLWERTGKLMLLWVRLYWGALHFWKWIILLLKLDSVFYDWLPSSEHQIPPIQDWAHLLDCTYPFLITQYLLPFNSSYLRWNCCVSSVSRPLRTAFNIATSGTFISAPTGRQAKGHLATIVVSISVCLLVKTSLNRHGNSSLGSCCSAEMPTFSFVCRLFTASCSSVGGAPEPIMFDLQREGSTKTFRSHIFMLCVTMLHVSTITKTKPYQDHSCSNSQRLSVFSSTICSCPTQITVTAWSLSLDLIQAQMKCFPTRYQVLLLWISFPFGNIFKKNEIRPASFWQIGTDHLSRPMMKETANVTYTMYPCSIFHVFSLNGNSWDSHNSWHFGLQLLFMLLTMDNVPI